MLAKTDASLTMVEPVVIEAPAEQHGDSDDDALLIAIARNLQ